MIEVLWNFSALYN